MSSGECVRGRLAPSPTGALHLGNARSFLIAWLSARNKDGSVVLRVEDLDHPKVKPGTMRQAMDDLRWLGLDWDEGPDVGGDNSPYVQSERIEHYRVALEKLIALGRVYPCTCSRRDVEAAQSAPHAEDYIMEYPGICRGRYDSYDCAAAAIGSDRLPGGRFIPLPGEIGFLDGFHGRISGDVAKRTGDFVLARHVHGAGYQLAVTVDDATMKITEVIRGDDLLECTLWQLHIALALGLKAPRYTHVPLVVGEDGRRLAKRHGDTRLAHLREAGVKPEKIVGLLAHWCGWCELGDEMSPGELIDKFTLKTIPASPIVLDRRIKEYLGDGSVI